MISTTLFKTTMRHLLRHPWQFGLAILGVALGVAVVVSIDLANDSASRAFAISTETLVGRTTHQIVGGSNGVDEAVYRQLRTELGVRAAAPVVEGYATAPQNPGLTLRILGIDPFAEAPFRPYLLPGDLSPDGNITALMTEPGSALMSASTAAAYGIAVGDEIGMQIASNDQIAQIIGLLEPQDSTSQQAIDSLLIADIATAQEWLGVAGRLDRIDLILPEGEAGDAIAEQIATVLPEDVRVVRPETRTETIEQMTAAFELNLTALSLLALIVGMFLIYNTMTFSVVQRRGLIGTLRCIGVTRRQIFTLVLGEALLVGILGTLAGLVLGVLLGRGLVTLVTQTINDLYFTVSVESVAISTTPLIKGAILGMVATLLASAVPAWEATSTSARTVLRRSSYEDRIRRAVPIAAGVGVGLLALGLGLLAIPSQSIVLSFTALFAMTIGAAALTPLMTLWLMQLVRPLLGRSFGLLGRMAARDVVAALSRTSVAIAALMIAVSVTIGVGLMVGSFRQTVIDWLGHTLQADVFVTSASLSSGPPTASALPPDLIDRFATTPGVDGIRRYRALTSETPLGMVTLIGTDIAPQRDRASYRFLAGDPTQLWDVFEQGGVLISEPLAYRNNLAPGDTIALYTDRGEQTFTIAGVYYDYGSQQGAITMDLATYRAYWDDQGISSLAIYAAPNVDVDNLVAQLRAQVGNDEVAQIRSNLSLRTESLIVFDRTFAITTVLQFLATIVAFVGVLAALMALQLERARELGVLRANGLTPRQLWGVVVSQTGLMGLTAGLLSIPVGIMLATVLVFVINKRSFGWTLFFQLDGALFLQALLVAIVAALLAGLYPAWRMSRISPALALREE
ncbi:MAG: ABC transporter permease [Chloroflexi bacterium AL-W]|nr:ABC transporter permease [Chloroflexi bacterium AL-N1]NOK69715.1 ABC transporter permease [Chloroflexi bacterium AL-N10]NOK73681.1 ABC transporter permease [Chloroflexi bacterium AL-N5]NOK83885.1 ABC transporter permease [Chloroflexi bacterium AL-W]NOK88012.1 ABC transporter permease [Chloroflexi bacterium AL-N15]